MPVGPGIRVTASASTVMEPGGSSDAMTMEDGSFVIESLGDFPFRVQAWDPEIRFRVEGVILDVRVGASELVLRARPLFRLTGKLLDDRGRPYAADLLRYEDAADERIWGQTRPPPDGTFQFRGIDARSVRLRVTRGEITRDLGIWSLPAENVEIVVK